MQDFVVSRNWFIEVNPGADCFEETFLNAGAENERISPKFEGQLWVLKPLFYAFIRHDQDIEEDGQPKQPHYHLVIKFSQPKTFLTMQKLFPGAHIEMSQSVSSSVQYLTHQNQPNKAQYSGNQIITNRLELLTKYLTIPQVEQFNRFDIWEYVSVDRMFTYTDFCIRFGVDQVQRFRTDIQTTIRDYIESLNTTETIAKLQHKKKH